MVAHPVVTRVVGNDFGIVASTGEEQVLRVGHNPVFCVVERSALFVHIVAITSYIWSENVL